MGVGWVDCSFPHDRPFSSTRSTPQTRQLVSWTWPPPIRALEDLPSAQLWTRLSPFQTGFENHGIMWLKTIGGMRPALLYRSEELLWKSCFSWEVKGWPWLKVMGVMDRRWTPCVIKDLARDIDLNEVRAMAGVFALHVEDTVAEAQALPWHILNDPVILRIQRVSKSSPSRPGETKGSPPQQVRVVCLPQESESPKTIGERNWQGNAFLWGENLVALFSVHLRPFSDYALLHCRESHRSYQGPS